MRGSTPVRAEVLDELRVTYDAAAEREFLVTGFKEGFRIPAEVFPDDAATRNHPSVMGNTGVVEDIIKKEIKLGRVCGPFEYPPLNNFHVSP